MISQKKSIVDITFEVAEILALNGHLDQSIIYLNQIFSTNIDKADWVSASKCAQLLIRIYIEKAEFDEIENLLTLLNELRLKSNFSYSSKLYSTIAYYYFCKNEHVLSSELFNLSFSIAIEKQNYLDMCYSMIGQIQLYRKSQNYSKAELLIQKINEILIYQNDKDLEVGLLNIQGQICIDQKKYNEAEIFLKDAFEKISLIKNINTAVTIIASYINCLMKLNKIDKASYYLDFLKKMEITKSHKLLITNLENELKKYSTTCYLEYDLVIDKYKNLVFEKKMGKISFKNQTLLIKLLILLAEKKGSCFSKETLSKELWNKQYSPLDHDNKIYVTIKRLRKLIEPTKANSQYILKNSLGYFLNDKISLLIIN